MQQSLNTTQRRKIGNKPIQSAPPTPNTLALGVATVKRNKWGTSPFDEHWLNLDCCGLICAFVTWSLHIYAVYAVDFILLPPWMSTPEGSEMGRSMSFWGHFHRVAFTITAGLACIAHFYAMTTDPGAVPPDANPLPAPEEEKIVAEEASEEQILVAPTQTGRRLCRRCRTFKPQRAHHCRCVCV
jgi:palmitoyltransferase